MKKLYSICPVRHVLLLASAVLILLHLILRKSYEVIHVIATSFVRPVNQLCTKITSVFSFSVAEFFIASLVMGGFAYLIFTVIICVKKKNFKIALYRLFITVLTIIAFVYAGFCTLWGAYFYDDDFAAKSGLNVDPISVEQLETVTEYFASLANYYSTQVQRDNNGVYTVDRKDIINKSPYVYEKVEEKFPCIEGHDVKVKGIRFSKIMSLIDFTGFYFPLTGEANVNMDFPPSMFSSTVAHEIAHQRGVCKEQECNFLAVASCLEYGDIDYVYSACLLAYTHLGNALHSADYSAWEKVYLSLDEAVLRDFAANREYWAKYETPVQKVSNTVYENFMYSYDQHMGLKSYGACVDLLVNYYYEEAAGHQ